MKSSRLSLQAKLTPNVSSGTVFKVIGIGGVGSIVSRYLCVFLGSLKKDLRLVLCDGDHFESSNATRMLFSTFGNKASIIRDDLLSYFKDTRLSIQAIETYVTPENIESLIHPGNIVILTVDNHATRKLVSDYCASLSDIALFSGGNDGVEPGSSGPRHRGTFGNVQIFLRQGGVNLTPSLTDQHPEIRNPKDTIPGENCTQLIASSPQILFANLATASAILNALWLYLCNNSLHYSESAFDIGDALMRPVEFIDKGNDPAPAHPLENSEYTPSIPFGPTG